MMIFNIYHNNKKIYIKGGKCLKPCEFSFQICENLKIFIEKASDCKDVGFFQTQGNEIFSFTDSK